MSDDVTPGGREAATVGNGSAQSNPVAGQQGGVGRQVSQALGGIGLGTEIAGYFLEEQIGEGGMAVVYRARDERLSRQVALKLLAPGLAADEAFRQRFIRESRAAAAVDHPNIIPVYEAGDAGGSLFIAMRYVQGGDVKSLLTQRGQLSAARTFSIVSQVAAALDAAHASGLIHRDVKPANMLLDATSRASRPGSDPDEEPRHIYLSDFGISKQSVSTSHLTSTGQFVGTLDYIAPEQIDGRKVDGRADLYSLGCATYEMLSGTPPFRRDEAIGLIAAHYSEPPPSLIARRPDLQAAVDAVVARAIAKSPDDRYPTCLEFAFDLGRALGLVPEPAPPGQPLPTTPVPLSRPTAPAPEPTAPAVARSAPNQHDLWTVKQPPPVAPRPNIPAVTQRPRRRSRALIASLTIAAIVVAGGVAGAIVFFRGHHSPRPSAASSQAAAISSLLTSSAASRSPLQGAATDVGSCTNVAAAVSKIQQVRNQRETEYTQAMLLSTGALPNGSVIKSDLIQALSASLTADNDYLNWAQRQSVSCQTGSPPSSALAADGQAVSAKTQFVDVWNPVARQYGLPTASAGSI